MDQSEAQRKLGWSNTDVELFGLIIRIMEIDPTFEKLEAVFEKGARLMKKLRSQPVRKNGTTKTPGHEEENVVSR